MMYFCLDANGKPDCRTWDQCHNRGCLAKPHAMRPLNTIADVVLNYQPKPKSKAGKKRARKKKRDEKNQKRESSI